MPDVDDAEDLKAFFAVIQGLNADGHILAYHDRSDGGLITSVLEMAFAGHCGVELNLDALADSREELAAVLFSEELGAVIQVREGATPEVLAQFSAAGLDDCVAVIGQPVNGYEINLNYNGETVYSAQRRILQRIWSETSYQIQRLRDNADCAEQEFDALLDEDNPGLSIKLSYDVNDDIAAPYIKKGVRPKVAILREQGVNGQVEMAAAFDRAGFAAIDVHMSDILAGRVDLDAFKGLSGLRWLLLRRRARRRRGLGQVDPLQRPRPRRLPGVLRAQGQLRPRRLQRLPDDVQPARADSRHRVLAALRAQPFRAVRGAGGDGQVQESSSIFLQGMAGSRLPIAIAHGEGHAEFESEEALLEADLSGCVSLRFVDNHGKVTEAYPANPNGSPRGITGLSSRDGRVTIMMPHPERVFRAVQNSWRRTTGRKTAAGCACSATPGSGWTDPAWRAMRTPTRRPTFFPRFAGSLPATPCGSVPAGLRLRFPIVPPTAATA